MQYFIKRKRYKTYDPELKRIVASTGNLQLALENGVPRTTANYWITSSKNVPANISCAEILLEKEIKSLNNKLEIEKAKLQFVSSLAKHIHLVNDGKKKTPRAIKRTFINKIETYKKYCSTKELISLINMSNSRYLKWKSENRRCENTKKFECGVKNINQLTGDEVLKISKLASSKKYFHFSLSSLWKFALKNEIIACSKDTWFKYVNLFNPDRNSNTKFCKTYKKGIRATRQNQIWHIDLTEFKLIDGTKIYLQAIIDNYSRYVIDWFVSESKFAKNTVKLLSKAKNKLKEKQDIEVYMDRGTENKNNSVNNIFTGSGLKQIFAKIDIHYSNSIIEAFFRSLKNNFLYFKKFKSISDFIRSIKFYINEHNNRIPHSAFEFETPAERYKNLWCNEKSKLIKRFKEKAIRLRKEINVNYKKCGNCLV